MSPLDRERAEVRTALFGGEGDVTVWGLGTGSSRGESALVPPFSAVVMAELASGGRVGKHRQDGQDELVIVLDGEGVLYVDGQANACVAGSVVGLAAGSVLEIDNASPTEALRYLIVKARR
jgi:quercetin dioxygenase-like cupin family protein